MSRTEPIELTVSCLIRNNGNILLLNRKDPDWNGYTLPGGHVEPGESLIHAVIREMKEETGLDIRCPEFCGIKQFPTSDGRYMVFLFCTDKFSGTVASSDEGEVRWVTPEELRVLHTTPDLLQTLAFMQNPTQTEVRYFYENGQEKYELR